MLDLNAVEWLGAPERKPGEPEHLNCFQRTLMPNCRILGISEEEAKRMGTYFGGGMRAQGTCGPVNAVLLLLGEIYGNDQASADKGKEFLIEFAKANGSWLCSDIRDEEHKHCEAAIEFAKAYIERIRG
ncbi:MAG: C_GCAxxG_C_C family protein [Parasporobacterium sp.]|nr:C_GCAxxG_C_C family protein [Parasporobacterium sp.]MBQ9032982.1 C_GCAxxG_C_C family protein [Parasporobacterium sp.]